MAQVDLRKSVREDMRKSVPKELWAENKRFVDGLTERVRQHPISTHSAIEALKDACFNAETLTQVHLDYRYAIVQVFTDALLMAQYQCCQLEPRFLPGQKMFARFLLTFNVLDEFGFTPEGAGSSYSGNPNNAHYPLYEKVLSDLGVSYDERQRYVPSVPASQLKEHLELSYDQLISVVALLMLGEEIVILFSAPLRENVKALGIDVSSGYYWCHGTSSDAQSQADDDTHAIDLQCVLIQALRPQDYEQVSQLCDKYCDLWMTFWDTQVERLASSSQLSAVNRMPVKV